MRLTRFRPVGFLSSPASRDLMDSNSPTESKARAERLAWRPVLLAVILVALPFAMLAARFDWICDDAFISFRYARNFASGLGLSYNPGESPPVEGYTNLLWVLCMALVERIGADPTVWSRALSLSSAIALFLWVGRHVQRTVDARLWILVPTLLFCATLPSIDVWATSGLAVMPMSLCLFGVYDRLLRDPERAYGFQAGLLACAAALLRADGLVYLAIILALCTATALIQRRMSLAKALVVCGGMLAFCVGAHFAWRYSYYGDWLPNTARVKAISGDAAARAARHERGLGYVVTYYMTVSSAILVPLASLAFLRMSETRRVVAHALLFLGAASVYAVLAGGDFMAFGRFLVPAMPFLTLLFAVLVKRTYARAGMVAAGLASLACVGLSLLPSFDVHIFPKSAFDRFHFRWNDVVKKRQSEFRRWIDMDKNARQWVQFGIMLPHVTEPKDSIVRGGIGAIGYYSGLRIYDTFGLTNLHWREVNPPLKRKSPGHDREMEARDFLEFAPTFLGYFAVVDLDADRFETLGGEERWNQRSYSKFSEPEIRPLPEGHGFPPGKGLVLLRIKQPN